MKGFHRTETKTLRDEIVAGRSNRYGWDCLCLPAVVESDSHRQSSSMVTVSPSTGILFPLEADAGLCVQEEAASEVKLEY